MFIDCHVHAVEEAPCPRAADGLQPISTPEQLLEVYDKVGIEKAVILPSGDFAYRLAGQHQLCSEQRRNVTHGQALPRPFYTFL